MSKKGVGLKPGREKPLLNRHHWLFSNAIASFSDVEDGAIVPVHSASGQLIGHGYFNRRMSLVGRMVSFGDIEPRGAITQNLESALALRRALRRDDTSAYRLVNGEGDLLPGLVVDQYADCLVIQLTTLGMDKLRSFLLAHLEAMCKPKSIIEKSTGPSRRSEGLADFNAVHLGVDPGGVEILENGLRFRVFPTLGQKTGFFLDHRSMRSLCRSYAKGRRVLNAFSYSGGFTVAALAGGALATTSVDISEKAIEEARANLELNGFAKQELCVGDVFNFLRERPLDYDLVILDPPAFAKKQQDVVKACRGYKDINRIAMQKMPKNSLLLTCSCSYHVDAGLFQKVLFQAALEAGRQVKILSGHRQAFDHPVNLCHPESNYLKSFLLHVA